VLVANDNRCCTLIRSVDTGAVRFRQFGVPTNATQEADRAVAVGFAEFTTGGKLALQTTRQEVDAFNLNYSSMMLPTTVSGIPTDLLEYYDVDAKYTLPPITTGLGNTMRYLVERLCTTSGKVSQSNCVLASASQSSGTVRGNVTSDRFIDCRFVPDYGASGWSTQYAKFHANHFFHLKVFMKRSIMSKLQKFLTTNLALAIALSPLGNILMPPLRR